MAFANEWSLSGKNVFSGCIPVAAAGYKRETNDCYRQLKEFRKMEIKRSGSQPSGKGPAEYFTGTVRIDPLFEAKDPARALGASVTFEPGARTAWHTHPLGQTLIVTADPRSESWAHSMS
jgi:hypothetical protein